MDKPTVSPITKKISHHAQTLGLDEEKIRTYQISLNWMLEHGTLVEVHVYGVSLFNTSATLAELGIQAGDIRAKRLRPGRRAIIVPHPTSHFHHIEEPYVYLGFSPDLPPPPAFYFRKAGRIAAMHVLVTLGAPEIWMPIPGAPQIETRWIPLDLPEEAWRMEEFQGEPARWLRLTIEPEKSQSQPDLKDITCSPITSLRSIEARCRKSVEKYGQKFAGFGGFAWIGYKAWRAWLAEWQRLEIEWSCVKDYILWRYDEFVAELDAQFEALADEAWRAMAARHTGKFAYLPDDGESKPLETQRDFGLFIIRQARERLPGRDIIKRGLRISYGVSLALGQADVAADQLAAEKIQTEVAKEWAVQTVEREQALTKRQIIWEEERLEQDRIEIEREKIKTDQRAMKAAALERAREQMSRMVNPYQAMLEQLRSEMHQAAMEIAASMKKHGNLPGKVAERARNLVEYCRVMNSHDDDELEALLDRLGNQLKGGGKEKRDNVAVGVVLDEIINLTEQAVQSLRDREADVYGFGGIEL